jgi:hypothetical protein
MSIFVLTVAFGILCPTCIYFAGHESTAARVRCAHDGCPDCQRFCLSYSMFLASVGPMATGLLLWAYFRA